ncbi:hormogonium polysaccharide secretion pseudopilin HpsB [Nodularia harveyana UHCC-0300]|uniref:Hormogonium polysaccharide secretion pseudopilin HpsB n=1 Tax=Nodularia harveyana UHCC-0300 TaxID=2974287 RepID=A0ABU5UCK8_9CYAN|nr:hormogonium polysaccharide secretion pseudopilin HpsB [Nodularia harveyana]MEA5581275.1 hormogonium polysaccharide secretion pseudopilin HpsB [Nodularia harveyana UHCC-0300]
MIKLKPKLTTSSAGDSGFTIIESLLAIVVVAILLAAISPVLVMSTATRVQSKRMEKASQATNTFIDSLRTRLIDAPGEYNAANKIELPAATEDDPRQLQENLITLQTMPVPTNATNLYLVKPDESICHTSLAACNSQSPSEEFYIQARQIIVGGNNGTADEGYRLALRVYRGDVDFNRPLLASNATQRLFEKSLRL